METTGNLRPGNTDGSHSPIPTGTEARAGVHNAIDKVSDAARPMVDRIASGAHQTVDKLAGVAAQAADTLGVKGEQLKNMQAQAMEQCRGYVRENPVASLGIAIAAGFLLSRLLSSR